jgi:hypothetical protein
MAAVVERNQNQSARSPPASPAPRDTHEQTLLWGAAARRIRNPFVDDYAADDDDDGGNGDDDDDDFLMN